MKVFFPLLNDDFQAVQNVTGLILQKTISLIMLKITSEQKTLKLKQLVTNMSIVILFEMYTIWGKLSLPTPNKVCEGYVFTGFCLSTGRGECVPHPPGQTPLWEGTPQADTPSWADTPQADTPSPPSRHLHPLGRHPHLGRHPCPVHAGIHTPHLVHAGMQSTSGQYASHWNAFLF